MASASSWEPTSTALSQITDCAPDGNCLSSSWFFGGSNWKAHSGLSEPQDLQYGPSQIFEYTQPSIMMICFANYTGHCH
ncbi:hypothetical protein VTK56DRAFT_8236 [Thermocarpiscus australiensis]